MSLNRKPAPSEVYVAASATVLGLLRVGPGGIIAQGAVVRSPAGTVEIGASSALLENSVAIGTLYSFRDKQPRIAPSAVLFDTAEITGDVWIGADSLVAAGVKIIGDSHGPVRVGDRVQILENAVLHLLPDNELVIEDDVVIGPGAMIHGCRIGRGTVVEPGAIVCDFSTVGEESMVLAGCCVKQRSRFEARAILDGFPARQVGELTAAPQLPGWALKRSDLGTLSRRR